MVKQVIRLVPIAISIDVGSQRMTARTQFCQKRCSLLPCEGIYIQMVGTRRGVSGNFPHRMFGQVKKNA